MSNKSSPVDTLLAENAELRARLEEAEETLNAIRQGKVDALVVEGPNGANIFTMQGLDAELNRFRGEILEQVSDAVIVLDDNQYVIYYNAAAAEQYGVRASDALGRHISEIYQERWPQPDDEVAMKAALRETSHWRGEYVHINRSGKEIHVESSMTRLHGGKAKLSGLLTVIRDITLRKHAEEEIKQIAFYDPLTSLPNRRLFLEHLKYSIYVSKREGKQSALMMLDLDNFKTVNDSFGHAAGDELLQQVAGRLTARLRDMDMVARLGGDEFVVFLDDIPYPASPARVASTIIADLSKPFQLHSSNSVQIGVSIGISLFPKHGDNPEILLTHADAALYNAKEKGRSCFAYFSEDLTLSVRNRIDLEARLRNAITREDLRVYYQPQVDIASGRIIGAEALLRWQDQSEGLIMPNRFIPIAECSGLIHPMGEWVLHQACSQGRKWLESGLSPFTIAVNLSPLQFRSCEIKGTVAKALAKTGFPAKQLELDLSESILMGNKDRTMPILEELHAEGIRVAVDNFGLDYSSLTCLQRYPVDVLKIDKSFIDEIPSDKEDMQLAAIMIGIGHGLGFKVLAQGVETLDQLTFLQDQGCDAYQGYIASQPVPAHEFTMLLANQN